MSSETVWVDVQIIHETDLAILVTVDPDSEDGDDVWLPKSQIQDSTSDMDIGADVELEIPVWLAEKVGLV